MALDPPARPPRFRVWPALALAALVVLTLSSASCSATLPATPTRTATPERDASVVWQSQGDWKHVDSVFSYLRANRPERPVVYVLGGSAARECTVSDRSWRSEIRAMGGPNVLAFNLGATNQSFDDNIGMVRSMPKVPSLVLIGINLGRYTRVAEEPYSAPAPNASLTLGQVDAYGQHKFDSHHILSDPRKIDRLTTYWKGTRQPDFDQNFAYNSQRLRDLVALCRELGLNVVLFNLPINMHTVAHRLDAPRERYSQDALAAAREYDVPYVDFVPDVPFVTRDFADNWHLVPTGRVKWQRKLAGTTVDWLARYGIRTTASPTSTP